MTNKISYPSYYEIELMKKLIQEKETEDLNEEFDPFIDKQIELEDINKALLRLNYNLIDVSFNLVNESIKTTAILVGSLLVNIVLILKIYFGVDL